MSKTIKFTISGDVNKAADQFVVIQAASPKRSNSILLQILRDEKTAQGDEKFRIIIPYNDPDAGGIIPFETFLFDASKTQSDIETELRKPAIEAVAIGAQSLNANPAIYELSTTVYVNGRPDGHGQVKLTDIDFWVVTKTRQTGTIQFNYFTAGTVYDGAELHCKQAT